MTRRLSCMLLSAWGFSFVVAPPLFSQTSKDKSSGLDRIEGTIQSLNCEKRSMTVRQRNRRNIIWTILYNDDTAITYQNEDTTAEDLQVGRRVIALGRFAENSIKLTALRIEIRSGK